MLSVTEVAVNRMLQRARQTVDREVRPGALDAAPLPDSPQEREVVSRFASAFQVGDIEAVVALPTDDALLTMPPEPLEFQGPAAISGFLSTVPAAGALERFLLVPTCANGQPAFGCYLRDLHSPCVRADGPHPARGRVAAITGLPTRVALRPSAFRQRCTNRW
jgi:RNA polymerase sigma-70 factor (ECF subfamily)